MLDDEEEGVPHGGARWRNRGVSLFASLGWCSKLTTRRRLAWPLHRRHGDIGKSVPKSYDFFV